MQHAVDYDTFNSGLNSRPLRPLFPEEQNEAANADNEICTGGHLGTWLLNVTHLQTQELKTGFMLK
jgi:hypothetical protein